LLNMPLTMQSSVRPSQSAGRPLSWPAGGAARRLLSCLAFAAVFPGPVAASDAELFTYRLRMSDVDEARGARGYINDDAPSNGRLIGFGSDYDASKRLPYTIGPGPVRAYVSVLPEHRDRRLSITLGGQTRSIVLSATTPRYHQAELTFDLPGATTEVLFRAESVDGQPQRIIWEQTVLTNDPDERSVSVAPGKSKLVRVPASADDPPGNLVPNSGFEEGIEGWDVTPYKSNVMVKPSLLADRAAHGRHSMDVGTIPITSRWFRLAGGRYSLSLFVADDNPVAVEVAVESRSTAGPQRQLLTVKTDDAEASTVAGWRRFAVPFAAALPEESMGGEHRIILTARGGDRPVLVDSVQITAGAEPAAYEPHLGLEAGFSNPTSQAIFDVGTPGEATFALVADPAARVGRVVYTITDYHDREVRPETALPAAAGTVPVSLPTDRAGLFRVRTRIDYAWQGADRTAWRDFFYNVVHPAAPRTDRLARSLLGGYFTAAPQGPLSSADSIRRFGIFEFNSLGHPLGRWLSNTVRDPDDRTRSLPGRYDFTAADREWQRFHDLDMGTVVNFHVRPEGGYGVAFGAGSGEPVAFKSGQTFGLTEWLDFVAAFATHFKGRVTRYVVQDEPYQSFTTPEYVALYLPTYRTVKETDPAARVFIHGGYSPMPAIAELNRITGGRAHESLDGVYLYLTQQHSGRKSRTAEPEFRQWIRAHDIPVMTPTCFSRGASFADRPVAGPPAYLAERAQEYRSAQHLFDALVWGRSQCFYYYYGAHPGGSYASLFDRHGRVIPLVHFYSAANALVGDVEASDSIDAFDPLRIGVIRTARGRDRAVLYSVDGGLHRLEADGAAFDGACDAFGNAVPLRREGSTMTVVVGPHPSYLGVRDAAAAVAALEGARVTPKVTASYAFEPDPSGGLVLLATLACDEPLDAWTVATDVRRRERTSIVRAEPVGDGKSLLRVPLAISAEVGFKTPPRIDVSTNLGDIYGLHDPEATWPPAPATTAAPEGPESLEKTVTPDQ
jgi:hypothetical protein